MQQQQQLQLQKEQEFWQNRRQEIKTSIIDAPLLDGLKLKPEHKELAAAALSQTSQSGDLLIYTIIDDLLAKKDFSTLAQMVLAGYDNKAYRDYISSQQKAEDAQTTIRALKTRDRGNTPTAQEDEGTNTSKLQRPQNGSLGSLRTR
jgi:hypothetical protein